MTNSTEINNIAETMRDVVTDLGMHDEIVKPKGFDASFKEALLTATEVTGLPLFMGEPET